MNVNMSNLGSLINVAKHDVRWVASSPNLVIVCLIPAIMAVDPEGWNRANVDWLFENIEKVMELAKAS